jgi:uncharacterized protein YqgV (UPF0045/DUF77 family)
VVVVRVRAEFTTEPFQGGGEPPAHVAAAAQPLEYAGLSPDLGPLGTAVDGSAAEVLPAIARAMEAAFASGATRFTLQVERVDQHG